MRRAAGALPQLSLLQFVTKERHPADELAALLLAADALGTWARPVVISAVPHEAPLVVLGEDLGQTHRRRGNRKSIYTAEWSRRRQGFSKKCMYREMVVADKGLEIC